VHPPSEKSLPCGDYTVQTTTSSITLIPNTNTNQRGVHINSCIPLPKNASVDCTLSIMTVSSITLTPNINTNKKGVHIDSYISLPKNASVDCTLFRMPASSITLIPNINTNKKGVHIDSYITLPKNASTNSTNTNFIIGCHSRKFWWGGFDSSLRHFKSSRVQTFQTHFKHLR